MNFSDEFVDMGFSSLTSVSYDDTASVFVTFPVRTGSQGMTCSRYSLAFIVSTSFATACIPGAALFYSPWRRRCTSILYWDRPQSRQVEQSRSCQQEVTHRNIAVHPVNFPNRAYCDWLAWSILYSVYIRSVGIIIVSHLINCLCVYVCDTKWRPKTKNVEGDEENCKVSKKWLCKCLMRK